MPTLINALDGKFIEPGGRPTGRPVGVGRDRLVDHVEGDDPISDVI